MEMARTRLQKGGSDCTGNTRLACAGKKGERKAEGDADAHRGEKLVKSVGWIWRSWHRIDGDGVNSLRPYASLRVQQELID